MVLKNNTASAIGFHGVVIPASSQITINNEELISELIHDERFWAKVDDSTVIVNTGTADLKPYDARRYLKKSPAQSIDVTFSDNTAPYITVTGSSYIVYARFLYRGNTHMGPANSIWCYYTFSGGFSSEPWIRIYDLTTSSQIVEKEFPIFSSIPPRPTNLGTLSNLPHGNVSPSIWEVQAKLVGTGTYRLHALSVYWNGYIGGPASGIGAFGLDGGAGGKLTPII